MSVIQTNSVVAMDFQLFAEDGRLVDNRLNYEFIQGVNDVLVGMRTQLEGARVGERLEGTVCAKDAFGELVEFEPLTYPKEAIGSEFYRFYIGCETSLNDASGEKVSLFVKDLTSIDVTFTINHPLAGQEIRFVATINGIRDATEKEVVQGHPMVHGTACSCC